MTASPELARAVKPSREDADSFDESLEEHLGVGFHRDLRVGFLAPLPFPVRDGHGTGQITGQLDIDSSGAGLDQ